ncbi:transposase family protein [Streptomyces sp. 4R-3d]|uniref:helix-turn-helix domain-containing protein n=1 Tax=Streptomyces sp. 4R-3d TaxID=2559605 RepID=UPI001FFE227E|nr:transposase family protein [Streptomyces sp. 4R-3d]
MGAGAKHRLVFVDRLLATLVHLRHGTTHDVPACWSGVDRSTITRAVNEVRPLLAERGCTVSTDVRLRTLAEVVGHLGATGKTGIIDGTEIRVRRPAQGARTGTSSSPARTSRTPSNPWRSRTAKDACCGAARPSPRVARTTPTHASRGWWSSWPTGPRSRSSPMPATRGSARRPADVQ